MSQQVERAAAAFKEGFSCSQAVLAACAEELGLDRETALRISSGFGGGMGRLGEVCGAVSGAAMALGLKYGRTEAADVARRDRTYRLVKELGERFRAQHGAITCRELLGCDIGTPEGDRFAREQGRYKACPEFVRDAAAMLEQMLEEA